MDSHLPVRANKRRCCGRGIGSSAEDPTILDRGERETYRTVMWWGLDKTLLVP